MIDTTLACVYTSNYADFAHWLEESKPGQIAIYYSGLLMESRLSETKRLRDRTYEAYLDGMVILTQRKIADGAGCEYLATKKPMPYRKIPTDIVHIRNRIGRSRYEEELRAFGRSQGCVRGSLRQLQELHRQAA